MFSEKWRNPVTQTVLLNMMEINLLKQAAFSSIGGMYLLRIVEIVFVLLQKLAAQSISTLLEY